MAFKFSFDEYMEDVYSQLECNASSEYKKYILLLHIQRKK